jgi:hypothetical protein
MAVTSHVYPQALDAIALKTINLTTDTFMCGLCTASAATWGSTQEAYQYVSAVTGAYTEVTSSGYARVTLTTLTYTVSANKAVWTCTSPAPISWGSSITLSAASMFVYDNTVGSGDSTHPVICIIDFGGTVASTSGAWTFTVDPTNGLAAWTAS